MTGVSVFASCVFLAVFTSSVTGMSNFVPKGACNSMIPSHNGLSAQTSNGVYSLTAVKQQQGNVQVTLSANNGQNFKGFFVKGFNGNTPIGSFNTDVNATPINCKENDNGIHHNNANNKTTITLTWQPPPNFNGQVFFKATVVQKYDTFWTNVKSDFV